MKTMKYIAVIGLVAALTACSPRSGPPWMAWMEEGPPPQEGVVYPELYVVGWKQGCQTGISSNTTHFNKFFYKYEQDSKLIMDDVYYRGWKDAFDYCQRYTKTYYARKFL